jgi:hypothetical protein
LAQPTVATPSCRDGVPLPRYWRAVVRPLEEPAEHAELVENFHRRGVDRVAAEIAEEVGVLLEHPHRDAGAREQQAGHDPGGAAPHHHDIGGCRVHRLCDMEAECTAPQSPRRCPTRW